MLQSGNKKQWKGKIWTLLSTPACLPLSAESSVLWVQSETWASRGRCSCFAAVRLKLLYGKMDAPALHESSHDCRMLHSGKTANLWSLWLQLPWVQEPVFIKKSECTKPVHGFIVCSLLSVHSWCFPRGRCNLLTHRNNLITLCLKLRPEPWGTRGTLTVKCYAILLQVLPGSEHDKLLHWKETHSGLIPTPVV